MKRPKSKPPESARRARRDDVDEVEDRTRRFYELHADQYAAATLTADLGRIWTVFEEQMPIGAAVADLGCGAGRDLRRFASSTLVPFGLDRSYPLCRIAHRFSSQPVVVGDLRQLPFRTAAFDGVWSAAAMLHLAAREVSAALSETRRVLKPAGVLMITLKEGRGTEVDDNGRRTRLYTERLARRTLAAAKLTVFEVVRSNEHREQRDIPWLALLARSGENNGGSNAR